MYTTMQRSKSIFLSTLNRFLNFKNCIKFISSESQTVVFDEDKLSLIEGLETDTDKSYIPIKKPRVEYSSTHFEAISKYLDSKECLQDVKSKVPSHFLLRTYKCPHSLYFIDGDIAKGVFSRLNPYLISNKSHILEVNAGAGVLTRYLLKSKLPRLRIYEADSTSFNELHIEVLRQKSDAKVFKFNLLKLWSMMKLDRNDKENRVDAAFEGLPLLSWEDEPVAKIIAIVPSASFILHIIHSIIFQNGICVHGRPELFLTMPAYLYEKFMAKPEEDLKEYRSRSVLFQLLFESEVLKSVLKEAILPWMKSGQKSKRKNITEKYAQRFLLVRVTPRQDLYQRIHPDLMKHFWFFVRILMQRRKDKVIAVIERWTPGAGVRLIAEGYSIYRTCGSLKPEEVLDLFHKFLSWPEYKVSSFSSSMEGLLVRMTDPGEAEVIMAEEEVKVNRKYKESRDNNLEEKNTKQSQETER